MLYFRCRVFHHKDCATNTLCVVLDRYVAFPIFYIIVTNSIENIFEYKSLCTSDYSFPIHLD